ncbi:SH3 domain-containing protein [Undibacterium sp. TC9W]|uniref:SH3 domain-containing protein n=1 Tax=Undibacterium sp. TC9W TaxID=3413053 RepID=UPI003BF2C7FF
MKIPILIAAAMLTGNALAESATTSKSTELMDKASVDGAVIGTLANQSRVDIIQHSGAWAQVKTSAGQGGWVRNAVLRLDASPNSNAAPASGGNLLGSLTSSGRTSNTSTVGNGVKGLDEEDIRRASPNYAELQKMQKFATDKNSAQTFAQRSPLVASNIEYSSQDKAGKRGGN